MRRLALFAVLCVWAASTACAVTVDGYAYLEGQTDHSGIKVKFVKVSPSAVTDSTYTDAAGYFTKSVVGGIYDVEYSKTGYLPRQLPNQSFLSDQTLSSVTLVPELPQISGDLSGVLGPGNFQVVGEITVQSGQILTIQPGTRLLFAGHYKFNVYGNLQAIGTAQDSIVFTRAYPTEESKWWGVRFQSASNACSLEFCVIEYGLATGSSPDYYGGGVYCSSSSPSFTNCTISGNSAQYGGGVYCYYSSPSFSNCIISGNWANYSAGVYCGSSSSPSFANCTISGNSANYNGGGVNCSHSSPSFSNCTISGNSAGSSGGGVWVDSSSPSFTNCTISSNSAVNDGGGVYCWFSSSPSFTNCTISGNSANHGGGGMYCNGSGASPSFSNCTLTANWGGGAYADYSSPRFTSTIIAFSQGAGINFTNSPASQIEYCDIFGNTGGSGQGPAFFGQRVTTNANGDSADVYLNIFEDPMFVDTAAGDYHLLPGSPCIDAGDPSLPHDPDSTIADIGAFYFEQALVISPSILLFGNVPVHGVGSLNTTLHNYTSGPIAIRSVVLTDPAFLSDYLPADSILGAHDSLQIGVTFSPDSSRSYTGTLQIQTSYTNKSVALSGVGIGAYVRSSSTSLDFGAVEPAFPETLSVYLTNRGNAVLLLNSLTLHVPYHVASFPDSIAAGDSGQVRISFNPTGNGLFGDTLLIFTNAYNDDSLQIALSGEGGLVPSPVQGVVLQVQGADAYLCWEPVVTTIHGNPLTVDAYLVYYSRYESGPFFFHGLTMDTCYTHEHVVQFADAMFYEVTAYVGPIQLLLDVLAELGNRPSKDALSAALLLRK